MVTIELTNYQARKLRGILLSDLKDCSHQLARLEDVRRRCAWPEIYDEVLQDVELKAALLVEVCQELKDEK